MIKSRLQHFIRTGLDSAELLWEAVKGNAKGRGLQLPHAVVSSVRSVSPILLHNVLLPPSSRAGSRYWEKVTYIGEKGGRKRAESAPGATGSFINFLLFQSCLRIHKMNFSIQLVKCG